MGVRIPSTAPRKRQVLDLSFCIKSEGVRTPRGRDREREPPVEGRVGHGTRRPWRKPQCGRPQLADCGSPSTAPSSEQASFVPIFLFLKNQSRISQFLLSVKSHARLDCSFVNAFATSSSHCQLFTGKCVLRGRRTCLFVCNQMGLDPSFIFLKICVDFMEI